MATNLASSLKGCRSWDDLQKRWKDCDKKTKGDLFEALVKNYLLLTPEFASKFKAVWGFKEIPSSVFQKLKLPSSDKGIDLVAETKEGDYWAIQCKYREDSSDQITWREISTFMGLYLGRKQISFGLIASTTERITKVLKDHDRVGFLAYDIWQGLDEEFFKRLQARLYKKKEPLKARLPRPHQKKAIRDAVAYFKKRGNSRGKLIMPCGTGKSLTSFFIAEKLKAQRVLIAVPSLSLIRQTLKEWMRESLARNHKVEWICVCSDESAGKIDQDDAVVLTQDLGVPCLTDSKQIANWLKRKHKFRTIIFTTYQSGQALAKAARNAAVAFDLGIMDEAHKTAGAKDRLFSHLILEKNIKIARRLFMTATERRYRGESDEILSMEDPDDYGETIHKLSFKKALEYKPAILSDYKVVTIHISQKEVAELVRDRAFVRLKTKGWNKEIEAENLAALIALRKAIKKYPIRHAVSFHGSIKRAQAFKESNEVYSKIFPSGGSFETYHVSGKTPTGARAREIEQFSKAQRSLITNARCLTEGVDVPNIDAVLFADPRKSLVDIVQSVGRALRPSPGKKFGYVIVPVVHKQNPNLNEMLESDSFREVLTTLRALGSQDERIIEYFRAVSQGRSPKNGKTFEGILTQKLAKRIDLKKFTKAVELRCWDRLANLSWRPFEEAREYTRKIGLKSKTKWFLWTKNKNKPYKPADIPTNPPYIYKGQGWKSWGDWLGTDSIATFRRNYLEFFKAREFVRRLNLRSMAEYSSYWSGKLRNKPARPAELPAHPDRAYAKKGWKGSGDWLGSGKIANQDRKFWSITKAKAFLKNLKFTNVKQWQDYSKGLDKKRGIRPETIPSNPGTTYTKKAGWKGFVDFMGIDKKGLYEKKYLPFNQARKYVRRLKIKNQEIWALYVAGKLKGKIKPKNIPGNPRKVYSKRGWISMGDWLGTNSVAPFLLPVRPFKKARKYVRKMKLKNIKEWQAFCKGEMIGLPKKPNDIPASPAKTYEKRGWKGIGDWLGTFSVAPKNRKFWDFEKARKYVRSLELQTMDQWRAFCKGKQKNKKPKEIPTHPHIVYKEAGWLGIKDFLGAEKWEFQKARKFVRAKKFKNFDEWRMYAAGRHKKYLKKPVNIPSNPEIFYKKKGWVNFGDWIGSDRVAFQFRKYRKFTMARKFAHSLQLKSSSEWVKYAKGLLPKKGKLPEDIPANVRGTYLNKGWRGMPDFLGTKK